ncbi:MAG: DUF4136 domain-containing protein [Rubrivivax sp.]|nr:DUF4136 domain-containing protein [Rubrivivax sp.]
MKRRTLALALAAAALAGCATLDSITCDVSSYGEWPAGRTAGTYAFERLPSQQAQAAEAEALEQAARPALEKAGFRPAAAGQEPEVLVQLGARFTQAQRSPWEESIWWRGGFGRWRTGPWVGPSWGFTWHMEPPRVDTEVALLLRDRASGKPLYETRAAYNSGLKADGTRLQAMFGAALMDFPKPALSPRRVTVPLAR